MDKLEGYSAKITEFAMTYGPKVIGAIIVLIVGLWIIKMIGGIFKRTLKKFEIDESLTPFLTGLFTTLLKLMLLISVAGMVGIETTSFIAVIGAGGLAIGMALQGSLANFAGGVLILIFKPYKIGDLIKAQGETGVVEEIKVFTTMIVTPDNRTIFIPNGPLAGGNIENMTYLDKRRVDMTFGIGYTDDIDKAKAVFKRVTDMDDKVLKEPGVDIFVSELGDSSVNFAVRPWCKPEHFWDVHFSTHENIKKALDKEGISIPFPQRDVYIHQVNNN